MARAREAYELALQSWLASRLPSGWVAIFEDSDGPRPRGSYATLKVSPLRKIGEANKRVRDVVLGANYEGELRNHFEGTCRVNVFGREARRVMDEELRISVDLDNVLESTHGDGLSISWSSDTLDVTELEGIRSVPRFLSDFFFHWSTRTTFEAEVVETVTVTET